MRLNMLPYQVSQPSPRRVGTRRTFSSHNERVSSSPSPNPPCAAKRNGLSLGGLLTLFEISSVNICFDVTILAQGNQVVGIIRTLFMP